MSSTSNANWMCSVRTWRDIVVTKGGQSGSEGADNDLRHCWRFPCLPFFVPLLPPCLLELQQIAAHVGVGACALLQHLERARGWMCVRECLGLYWMIMHRSVQGVHSWRGRTFKTYSALASTADSGAFFIPRVTGNSVLSKRKIHGQSSGEGVAATGGTMPSMPVPADKWWSIHAWGACIHVMLYNGGAERRDNVH